MTSGGNTLSDFPENQLTKNTDKNDKSVLLQHSTQTDGDKTTSFG